jgi:hypothetical protein
MFEAPAARHRIERRGLEGELVCEFESDIGR